MKYIIHDIFHVLGRYHEYYEPTEGKLEHFVLHVVKKLHIVVYMYMFVSIM